MGSERGLKGFNAAGAGGERGGWGRRGGCSSRSGRVTTRGGRTTAVAKPCPLLSRSPRT